MEERYFKRDISWLSFNYRVLLEADVSRKKRKKVVDKMAAVLILQGYLDYTANQAARRQNDE